MLDIYVKKTISKTTPGEGTSGNEMFQDFYPSVSTTTHSLTPKRLANNEKKKNMQDFAQTLMSNSILFLYNHDK